MVNSAVHSEALLPDLITSKIDPSSRFFVERTSLMAIRVEEVYL